MANLHMQNHGCMGQIFYPCLSILLSNMPPAQKIDVHSHFMPAKYRQACEENGHKNNDGMPGLPFWTEEAHLEMMDSLNISKSILSISSPGTHLVYGDDELGRRVTRECNLHAADMKKR